MSNATECISTAAPLRVHMWQNCPVTNEYCQYSLSVENAPSCGSFSINVVPPPGEDISNSCAIYEQQVGCKLKDEVWYDAQDNPIITMSNGSPTHNPTPETCRTSAIAGTACKEWWRKSRGYRCVASNTAFSPDTSRAMSAAMSADNGGGSSVHFTRSTLNKENTGNCLIEVTSSSTSLSASDCSAYGGSMQSGSCITKGYLSSACIYQDPSTKTGLYCDTVSVASIVFPDEISRRVSRDCIEQSQCNVTCVVGMPGNATQTVSCINNGNNTYSCPSGGNPIIKDCDCSIATWDPTLTQGESCEVACLVDEYGSETSSNVTRDYRLLTCNKTYVGGAAQYTCPLSGGQQLRQDCACVDTFGLSAGVLGALSQALKDRECQ